MVMVFDVRELMMVMMVMTTMDDDGRLMIDDDDSCSLLMYGDGRCYDDIVGVCNVG